MSDFTDPNIITDEIYTGTSSPTSPDESTIGTIPVDEIDEETDEHPESSDVDETEISSPSVKVVQKTSHQAASEDSTSLDNLRAVSRAFDTGCKTVPEIIKITGLSQPVVLACIKWLSDNSLLAVTGAVYCTIDNVSTLHNQLKACQKCKW